MKTEHGREAGSGRYCHTVDRPCKCGHSLDAHTAARVKTPTGTYQDCLEADCGCQCFTKVRK